MKKNKIIGALIGVLGVAVSIGTAVALYTKPVANLEFTIGSATHTTSLSNVDYLINDSSSPAVLPEYYTAGAHENHGSAFDGSYVCAKYSYTLGASFAEDVTAQDYIMGNLSVSLTGINEGLFNKVRVSMYFEGYGENNNKLGKALYSSNLQTDAESPQTIDKYVLSSSSLLVKSRDICVARSGAQKFIIYFELIDDVVLAMNEANNLWTLSVSWGKPSDSFVYAYMVNNKTIFEEDDEFAMAPNIWADYYGESNWEWYGQIAGSSEITAAKCRQGATWSDGADFELTSGKTYNVVWSGRGSDAASFTERS